MEKFDLTEQQKKYLLHFGDVKKRMGISDFSKDFSCSRQNSKKILDRMVKLGLLYKEENDYLLSSIAESVAKEIYDDRNSVRDFLINVFNEDEELATMHANALSISNKEFTNFFINKTKIFDKLPRLKTPMSYKSFEELVGEGKYKISFIIYKKYSAEKQSAIQLSMANKAYENHAELIVSDESIVKLQSKSLKENHKGFFKQGVVKELIYKENGKDCAVPVEDSYLKIPLKVFKIWEYLGNGIFCSSACLKNSASVGFVSHNHESNYFLVLNVLEN